MLIKLQGQWEAMAIAHLLNRSSDSTLFLIGKSSAWAQDLAGRIRTQVRDKQAKNALLSSSKRKGAK